MNFKKKDLGYILSCIALGLFIAYRVSHQDMWRVGSDTISHLFQIKLLIEQIRTEKNPLLWGSWNWNWYCGYPFLKAYSPLYHFIVAFMSILFNLPPETCMVITAYIFYPSAILLAYTLAYYLSKNKLVSCISAYVYGGCAAVTSYVTSNGNPQYLPGLPITLATLLLIQKVIDTEGKDIKSIVGVGLCLSLLIYVSMRHAIRIPYYMLILLVVIAVKKVKPKALLSLPIAILASLASALPLAYYLWFYGSPTYGPMLDVGVRTPLKALNYLVSPWDRGLGPLASSMLFLSIACFLWDTCKARRSITQNRFFPYMVSVIVALSAYYSIFVLAHFTNKIIFKVFLGKNIVDFLIATTPVTTAYVLSKIASSLFVAKKYSIITLSVMLVASSYLVSTAAYWHQPLPSRWENAYQTIVENEQNSIVWFRVHHLPTYPPPLVVQMAYNLPSLDGWYWQGAIKGIYKEGFLPSECTTPNVAVRLFKVLNVKYLVIDTSDPLFGKAMADVAEMYLNSSSVTLVYEENSIYVFKIDPYPILASTNLFIISEGDEIQAYRSIVIDDRFNLSLIHI